MPLVVRHGDLFSTQNQVIVHGASLEGKMDVGFNLKMKQLHPEVFNHYHTVCVQDDPCLGEFIAYTADDGTVVYTLFMQSVVGKRVLFPDLRLGLTRVYSDLKDRHFRLPSMPLIGSGLGGLPWLPTQNLVESLSDRYNCTTQVWRL